MPDSPARPVPVWRVKFFRDLRSLTPTRIAYISRASEVEVAERAYECMADEEACRVGICRIVVGSPILASIGSIKPARRPSFATGAYRAPGLPAVYDATEPATRCGASIGCSQ